MGMAPIRQIEAAELMVGQNNFTGMFAKALPSARPVDRSLLTMIARGCAWRHQLVTGEVTSALESARRGNVTGSYVSRIINLGFLAPDIIAAIADGLAPIDLTANKLKTIRNIPLDWPSQRQVLGF